MSVISYDPPGGKVQMEDEIKFPDNKEIIELLDLISSSPIEEFRLEIGANRLVISKNADGAVRFEQTADTGTGASDAGSREQPQATNEMIVKEKLRQDATKPAPVEIPEGLEQVTAPLLGIYYQAPEPGAAPFVQAGDKVEEDTTVCLIEVMKLFNAVKAGIRGTIEQVLVNNGDMVEFGQPLFLVKPEGND